MINTNTVSTRREENSIISVRKMCVVALAIVLNVIGGQIALMLHLPIYTDPSTACFRPCSTALSWDLPLIFIPCISCLSV